MTSSPLKLIRQSGVIIVWNCRSHFLSVFHLVKASLLNFSYTAVYTWGSGFEVSLLTSGQFEVDISHWGQFSMSCCWSILLYTLFVLGNAVELFFVNCPWNHKNLSRKFMLSEGQIVKICPAINKFFFLVNISRDAYIDKRTRTFTSPLSVYPLHWWQDSWLL